MTVIKSLCKNFASTAALNGELQKRQLGEFCLVRDASQPETFAGADY
jgi:hypothetical protein